MTTEIREATLLKVGCPYCLASGIPGGHAVVEIVHRNGADQLVGMNDPRRCNVCQRYFRLKLQFKVLGVPLAAQPAVPQGTILRNALGVG